MDILFTGCHNTSVMPNKSPTETSFTVKPMAWLKADFQQKFGIPRQGTLAKSSRARVELSQEWRGRGILSGLEGFSHVWVVSFLHLSENKRTRGKVHPPRLKGAKVGILASRSPHRPNNIGLTLARIEKCEGDELLLSGIDLVDGTPILDLKPYHAMADRPAEFKSGWIESAEYTERECEFTERALNELHEISSEPERIRRLIHEMLTQDPRPPVDWDKPEAEFAVYVSGLNVKFRFHAGKFTVETVERQAVALI